MVAADSAATLLAILSAITVAAIGVLTRATTDRYGYLSILNATSALAVLPILPLAPWPTAVAWNWLCISVVVHLSYQLAMAHTLKQGDLSLGFPVMRGLAPLLVALLAVSVFNERLSPLGWIGLLTSTAALVAFGMVGGGADRTVPPRNVLGWAAATSLLVAAYSIVDAAGVRAMGPGRGWGFVVWFFALSGLPMMVICSTQRWRSLRTTVAQSWRSGVAAGFLSLVSYGSALLAMGLAPVAQVSAIRETSVVFASVFAWLILGEPLGWRRTALATTIAFGLVLLKNG